MLQVDFSRQGAEPKFTELCDPLVLKFEGTIVLETNTLLLDKDVVLIRARLNGAPFIVWNFREGWHALGPVMFECRARVSPFIFRLESIVRG